MNVVKEIDDKSSKLVIGILWTPHNNPAAAKIMDLVEQYVPYEQIKLIHSCQRDADVDVVIIPGGADIDPQGGVGSFSHQQKPDPYVTAFFARKGPVNFYLERGVKLFGICAGFQALGVFCGLRLRPHFDGHTVGATHKATSTSPEMIKGMPSECHINSRHHQGFFKTEIPAECSVIPLVHVGRVLEAFITVEGDVCGVQWHPEDHHNAPDSTDFNSAGEMLVGDVFFHRIFSYFINL